MKKGTDARTLRHGDLGPDRRQPKGDTATKSCSHDIPDGPSRTAAADNGDLYCAPCAAIALGPLVRSSLHYASFDIESEGFARQMTRLTDHGVCIAEEKQSK